MATMPASFRRTDTQDLPSRPQAVRQARDPFELRPLPQEDVFFYCKKIDNSRLVREADPQARGACWHAIGAACLVVAALTAVAAPSVTTTLAGYKMETLRAEERRLQDELRTLELQEAQLLSPERLEQLAKKHDLVAPESGQVVHLEDPNKPESAALLVK
jgi:cell division protein FtsL